MAKAVALKPRKRAKPDPETRPLTEKQEAWCVWMVSAEVNFNATEAARRAGYKGSDKTLAVVGSENLRKPNVRKRLEGLKAKALSGAHITVESILRDLDVIKARALESDQLASATRCTELQGKYLKMFTDRIEHVQSIDEISDEQLWNLIAELSERAGVDLSRTTTGNGATHGSVPGAPGTQKPH